MDSSLQLLLVAAVALLISPAISQSQTCRSQTFNATFANCADLPTLRAYLHWTYDPSARPNPTLDIAFVAPPAGPNGWISWAINPAGLRMLGAQALVAFGDGGGNGSVSVRTYNISSYNLTESQIAYAVLRLRAESSDGVMRIFATLALPAGGPTELNHVWQVGAAVTNRVPAAHAMGSDNMNSVGTLRLGGTAAEPTPAPAPESGGGGGGTRGGNDRGGSWRVGAGGLGLYGSLVLLGVFLCF